MKIGKDTQNAARRLFRLCMDGNAVAEDRVRLIARKIAERKPRNYAALLKAFSGMVEYAVKSRTATIQSAVPLTEEERSLIQAKLEARYGGVLYYRWEVEPSLLAGFIASPITPPGNSIISLSMTPLSPSILATPSPTERMTPTFS